MGTVDLSNARLIFKTDDGNVAQAPYDTILTYDAYRDGLALNVAKIGVMQFKAGDPCLGAIFLKMVRQPSSARLRYPAVNAGRLHDRCVMSDAAVETKRLGR